MAGMRKLRAVIVEDDIDAVVESLGEGGIAEFIDMHNKLEEWNGVLRPHRVSPEAITKCSKLLSRIEDSFEKLDVKPEDLHSEGIPELKEPIADILARVEQRLDELPIETRIKSLAFVSRIDPFMETLGGKLENGKIDQNILEKTVEKTFAALESDFSGIAYPINTKDLADYSSPVEKRMAFAIENKVDVGRKIAEYRSYCKESNRLFGEQLLSLKHLVEASMETIETETKFGEIREGLITLRNTVEMEKQIPRAQEEFDK
jgi:vacuolar-type H+-ATPase subunit I/STV1